MSRRTVKAALDARMQAFTAPGMGDFVWEGAVYTPNEGAPYIAMRLSAYTRTPLGAGADCVFSEDGMYQITVFRPSAEGEARAGYVAEQLVAWFSRGLVLLDAAGQRVVIINASEMPAQPTGNWLSLPVVITWTSSIP